MDSEEAAGAIGRKDSTTIQYDSISQAGSVQSIMSSDIDNENDDNTENDVKDEQQDIPSHEAKSRVKMNTFNDHLKSQDFQVCVTIIEARQLPGMEIFLQKFPLFIKKTSQDLIWIQSCAFKLGIKRSTQAWRKAQIVHTTMRLVNVFLFDL